MSNPTTEKELVGKFVLWAASLEDGRGTLCSPEHVEAIKAAAERLVRQMQATARAGRATSERKAEAARENAKRGGAPKGNRNATRKGEK
ncbi:MAG TPA: hypothetical protein VN256_13005 [Pyrinomonadaceae bacterium]|nr:hypothetical protein [Pyrinomonadaceae bacterium]